MKYWTPFFSSLLLLIALTGCSKYVDIKTQGNLIPSDAGNYRLLLNNNAVFEPTVQLPDVASDDIDIKDSAQAAQLRASAFYAPIANAYNWLSPIYPTAADRDADWSRLYTIIYNANIILSEVPTSNNATDSVKRELMAEAMVHRADAYLTLVNMYAKPYTTATATTDLGVPVLTTPDVSGNLTRALVATVYTRVTTDLVTALPGLPRYNTLNLFPSKAAAYALLARTYLYMANYTEAGKWADSALGLQSTLLNLASLTTATYPKRINNPEIILSKQASATSGYMPSAFRLSDTLLNVLGTTDLRYALFTTPASSFSSTLYTGRFFFQERIGNFETRNLGPSVPEMMLIKAETLARSGDIINSLSLVNALRQKRFTAAAYTPLAANAATQALMIVMQERQREFFCRGLRWFDMRRLKDDATFGQRTISRRFGSQTIMLAPGSPRYVFPISEYVRSFSPGIEQNP